jgi:hypothetical protein
MSHEDFHRKQNIEIGSNLGFGLTVGGILAAIGAVRGYLLGELGNLEVGLLAAGSAIVFFAFAAADLLSPLNKAWMKFGLLLSKIVAPVVMGLIFYTTVTPTGFVMRLLGKDLLRTKRDSEAVTYWVIRTPPGPGPETMKNQF